MIKVTYQLYGNDLCRIKNQVKYFNNLEELNDWIIENYHYREYYCMGQTHHTHIYYGEGYINFQSEKLNFNPRQFRFVSVWIEMIENENGIMYTNGEHTQGIKHMSQEINAKFEEWRKIDKEDPKHLKKLNFKFID